MRYGIIVVAAAFILTFAFSDVGTAQQCSDKSETALELNRAELGRFAAQAGLGSMSGTACGARQDHMKSLPWYGKATEQDIAFAQRSLAFMHAERQAKSRNFIEAVVSWYGWVAEYRAAEQGNVFAQLEIGRMYEYGRQDYVEAVAWYRKAAEQGEPDAQFKLAEMYEQGLGVRQDYNEAADLYRKAAEQGDDNAQFKLGEMYAEGHGVRQDYEIAYMWFTSVATHFEIRSKDEAAKPLHMPAAKITPKKMAEAKLLASERMKTIKRYLR